MFPRLFPLLLLACGASHAPAPRVPVVPYDLGRPSAVFVLPADLTEISALTDVDSATVACVQDEAGVIHFISMRDGKRTGTAPFAGPGDMEGLTRVGNDYFALRSDGLVYHLRQQTRAEMVRFAVADTFRLAVPVHNIEGLGYDERAGRVLVSPKDFAKGSKEDRDERVLYAFDPTDPARKVDTVLRLSLAGLLAEARAKGIAVPERSTPKGRSVPALKLRFSSVAVHPVSGHYYVLSAVDRALLVLDRQGGLVALETLDAGLLPKPEGITFLADGDLVLSSEGRGSAPVIVRYQYIAGR